MTGPSSPRVGLISDRAPTCAPKTPFQQFYLRSAKKTGSKNGPKSPKIFVTVKSKLVAKIDTDRMKPLTISSCGVACIHTDNRTNVSQKTHDQSRRVIFHRTVRETPERQTKERERDSESGSDCRSRRKAECLYLASQHCHACWFLISKRYIHPSLPPFSSSSWLFLRCGQYIRTANKSIHYTTFMYFKISRV